MMDGDEPTDFDLISDWMAILMDEVVRCWERVPGRDVEELVQLMAPCRRLLVAGTGRCSHLLAAQAARFRELGMRVDVWTSAGRPEIAPGANVLVASPSGAEPEMLALAAAARASGAKVAACVGRAGSPLAAAADVSLLIDAFSPGNGRPPSSQQRPGALFDQMVLVLLDSLAETLAQRRALDGPDP